MYTKYLSFSYIAYSLPLAYYPTLLIYTHTHVYVHTHTHTQLTPPGVDEVVKMGGVEGGASSPVGLRSPVFDVRGLV